METLWQDLRCALRVFAKQPAFVITAVVALALGVGANSAIFSVINAVLLRPLPYEEPGQLVLIWHRYEGINLLKASISPPSFIDYRDRNQAFETMGVFTGWNVNLTGIGTPERLRGVLVSSGYFPTLRVNPLLGRIFTADDDQPGHDRVVVVSHGLWRRLLGADAQIVGRSLTLNGNAYTIIGVMPADFESPQEVDIWAPIAFTPEQVGYDRIGSEYLILVSRMKQGTTLVQAQTDMDQIAADHRDRFYEDDGWGISVVHLFLPPSPY